MINKKEDRYGINIIKYCSKHEQYIIKKLEEGDNPQKLLKWHEKKLAWIQYERLIHLIVMGMTMIAFLFTLFMFVFMQYNFWIGCLLLILLLLLGAYIIHYFKLENTVQHWYTIAERLKDMSDLKERQ